MTVQTKTVQTLGRRLAPGSPPPRLALGSFVLLGCLLSLGCGPSALPPSDAAAQIDHEEIPYRQFEAYLENNVGAEKASLAPQTLAKLFEQFLDEEILVRSAIERGSVPLGTERREAVRRVLAEASMVEISSEEIAEVYEADPERFERPERVRLRQILVAERAEAEKALEALRHESLVLCSAEKQ